MRRVVDGTHSTRKTGRAETPGELLRIRAAVWIAGGALLIGTLSLAAALLTGDAELRTWATSLISLVVGTAIGFIFSNVRGRS